MGCVGLGGEGCMTERSTGASNVVIETIRPGLVTRTFRETSNISTIYFLFRKLKIDYTRIIRYCVKRVIRSDKKVLGFNTALNVELLTI